MTEMMISNIVGLEKRRDKLEEELSIAESSLQGEMVRVACQLAEGKTVPPAVSLVLARNSLPDFDFDEG